MEERKLKQFEIYKIATSRFTEKKGTKIKINPLTLTKREAVENGELVKIQSNQLTNKILDYFAEFGIPNTKLEMAELIVNIVVPPESKKSGEKEYAELAKKGFDLNGKHYVRLYSGSGQIRRNTITFIREDLYEPIFTSLLCGLTLEDFGDDFNAAKFNAYCGLNMSGCYLLPEELTPNVCVVDDFEAIRPHNKVSEWDIKLFQLTTNGTIIDEKIVRCLNKLCSHKPECCSILRISGDQYHNTNQAQLAYEAYSNFPKSDKVTVLIKEDLNSIKYSGRAKDIVEKNPEQLPKDKDFLGIAVPYINQYRIPVKDTTIQTDLIICSNGNVSFSEEVSFAELDLLAIGNLLDSNLKTLIESHNRDCVLTHCDWDNIQTIKQSLIGFNDYGLEVYIRDKVGELIFDRIYNLRLEAHKLYPYVPAQNIILNLPMPKDYIFDIQDETDSIYEIIKPIFKDMSMAEWSEWLRNVNTEAYNIYEAKQNEFNTDRKKSFSVYAVLQNPSMLEDEMLNLLYEYTFFFRLVTTQNYMETLEFKRLEQLNEKYKAGELKYHNDKLLPYDIGDSLFGEGNLFQAVLDRLIKQSGKKEDFIELQNGIEILI